MLAESPDRVYSYSYEKNTLLTWINLIRFHRWDSLEDSHCRKGLGGTSRTTPLHRRSHPWVYTLCQEAAEKKEDIRHFRTTAACITDNIATLIREKEEVVRAENWRKRQEEEKAEKQAEQQRKEEIALGMQHGMEGR